MANKIKIIEFPVFGYKVHVELTKDIKKSLAKHKIIQFHPDIWYENAAALTTTDHVLSKSFISLRMQIYKV